MVATWEFVNNVSASLYLLINALLSIRGRIDYFPWCPITLGWQSNGSQREPWIIFVKLVQPDVSDVHPHTGMHRGKAHWTDASQCREPSEKVAGFFLWKTKFLTSSNILQDRCMGFWKIMQFLFKQKQEAYSLAYDTAAKVVWTPRAASHG